MLESEKTESASREAKARFEGLGKQGMRVVAPNTDFFGGAAASLKDIWDHRELWWLLTKRETKARYKDSAGGFVWSLIRPLVMLMIYYFVIGRILGAERMIDDFSIYIFAGLTAWTLFASIISTSTASIVANSGIVKKIYLPREIFPFSSAGAAFIDFLAQFAILFVAAWLIGGIDWIHLVVYVPVATLLMLVWGLALGLFLAAANVYLRDIQYLVDVILSIGFWMTPSLYSYAMVAERMPEWLVNLYLLNPTAIGVFGMQQGTWTAGDLTGVWPDHLMIRMLAMIGVGLALLFVNQRIFARLQRNFAQEI